MLLKLVVKMANSKYIIEYGRKKQSKTKIIHKQIPDSDGLSKAIFSDQIQNLAKNTIVRSGL